MNARRAILLLSVLALGAGCGGGPLAEDAGQLTDGGAHDGGAQDAGEDGGADAGQLADGGEAHDGGEQADAGQLADGGEVLDGGEQVDAGGGSDGGEPADAGAPHDGGTQPDEARLDAVQPAATTLTEGHTETFTVTIDRPAPPGGAVISLSSSNPAVAEPTAVALTIGEGMTTGTFTVTAVSAGGPVDITVTLGASVMVVQVTVTAGGPAVVSLTPTAVEVMTSGGTALLTVTLNAAAGAGGQQVNLTVDDPSVAVPPAVTIPQGQTRAAFRVRGDGSPGAAAIVGASIAGTPITSTVSVVGAASTPTVGDLVLNEVNFDVPVSGGDANCDGTTNSITDEFIEFVNVSTHPIALGGATIWDDTTTPRYSFPSFVLGAGEPVVVFGGARGTSSLPFPWCVNVTATHIGDAAAFSGANLALGNTGDTVSVTLGTMKGVNELVAPTTLSSTVPDVALTRAPDMTGPLMPHTSAPGAATDRVVSPGTLNTGRTFSEADP